MSNIHQQLQELKEDKSAYLEEIRKLKAKVRSLRIERDCLRAEVDSYRMTDEDLVKETIRRLKEGLPQPINAES